MVGRLPQDHGGAARYDPLSNGSRFSLVLPRTAGT